MTAVFVFSFCTPTSCTTVYAVPECYVRYSRGDVRLCYGFVELLGPLVYAPACC